MLPCLVVDDDVDPKERHAQCLPQGPGEFSDDLVTWPLKHALDLVQLPTHIGVRPWEEKEVPYYATETPV
jgi:hypothetical protein